MTPNELKVAPKAAIIEHVSNLNAQLEEATAAAQSNSQLASFFGGKLLRIEQLLNAPFLSKGILKKLFWVATNWNVILTLIKDIKSEIEDWRKQIQDINEKAGREVVQIPPAPTNDAV